MKLPEDLDRYLQKSETRFTNIVPDTEKTIVWADPLRKAPTPLSIVYLHGFSATRQETYPLSDMIAERLEANLFYTRLTGHGRGEQAMAEATAHDWLEDGTEALAIGRRLGKQVIIIATSTGATLALWLAAQESVRDIRALVLISPNFGPRAYGAPILTWPGGESIARLLIGTHRRFEPTNTLHARYWTSRYPIRALVPMMTLVRLLRRLPLDAVETPTLIFYCENDQVVDPAKIKKGFERLGAPKKRLIAVENVQDSSCHVLAGNILSPATTPVLVQQALDFLATL